MKIIFIITLILSLASRASFLCTENNLFDYIVVGSGSSGSVVAARLSENANVTVLLLEAGREPTLLSAIPLISYKSLRTEMDWNYTSVSQEDCCFAFKENAVPLYQGRALGGTSSINFFQYTRGNKRDFDLWDSFGNPGWSYKNILPYLLKLEDYRIGKDCCDDLHHRGGPMTVMLPPFKTPFAEAFLEAGNELNQPIIDFNGENQTGFMYPPTTMRDGERCSTYVAYLKPAMKRTNLQIMTEVYVTKILFDDYKRATGVKYEKHSSECTVTAKKEIIISAGAINSPKLLMLSGIGPKKHLRKHHIPLVHNLPGVGQNLQDHVGFGGLLYSVNQSITANIRYETEFYKELWKETKNGPMTITDAFEGISFYSTKLAKDKQWPDIEIFFKSDNLIRLYKEMIEWYFAIFLPKDDANIITFVPLLMRPKSRGYIKLRSNDPYDHPLINPKFLSHPDDVHVLAEGVKFGRLLAKTKAFKRYGAKPAFPLDLVTFCIPFLINRDEHDKCLVRIFSSTGYHPTSTCKMGPSSDPLAVVDNQLKVHGVKALRIVDASIMPTIVTAHPNAACIMIGEKASDMIKEDNNMFKVPDKM